MNAVSKAIDIFGGPSNLAHALGVTPQAVCFWRDGQRRFPADLCPKLEQVTSRAVTCEELRPDVDWAYLRATNCPSSNCEAANA